MLAKEQRGSWHGERQNILTSHVGVARLRGDRILLCRKVYWFHAMYELIDVLGSDRERNVQLRTNVVGGVYSRS